MKCEQAFQGFEGQAEGLEAMQIQERIIKEHLRAANIRIIGAYSVSVVFGMLAFVLIMFGPSDRAVASNIFSGSFLVLAAGIAGYTQLKAQAPGISVEALRQELQLAVNRVPRKKLSLAE